MRRDKVILRKAEAEGWNLVRTTGANHLKLRHTTGAVAFIASTPSDRRGEQNCLSMLRRLAQAQRA